jgi:hypothetical protein
MLAAAARPLEEVALDQIRYLTLNDPSSVSAAQLMVQQVRDPALAPAAPVDILGSRLPGAYFLDLRAYNATSVARNLKMPMFIIQGGRDYQVTEADFALWTKALADRPNGLTRTHIANLESFYRDTQGWSAGPHLFVDDRQIWVFTPLTLSGVHSPSWNKLALGVEMLGNYESEPFNEGRGLRVRVNTVAAIATLCAVIGIDPELLKLHKEDRLTTHACPGRKVIKKAVIREIQELMVERHSGEHEPINQ